MSFINDLNPSQKAAVQQTEGPILVIAGAGSGKTRVLTYKIAYLMEKGVDPFNILALTFTNKAAKEMKERIVSLVGTEAKNIWAGTFHSIFARILRAESEKLGYPSNFSIYDMTDAKSLIKSIIKEQNLNDKLYKPNIVLYRISSAKNSLISPKQYKEDITLVNEDISSGRPKLAELYHVYVKRCFQAGAMDFDDLLIKMYELLVRFPEVLHKYQHQFKFLLVDEFQDTNYAQYAIIKKISDVYQNVCVVGDDAQSIYSFRGAMIENIINFEKNYPELKTYKLEQNYRSTKNIVEAANSIINNNKTQIPKKLWTGNADGNKIKIIKASSDNEEGKFIADSIMEERMRNHYKNEEFAILYRTNAQSRSFEESLRRHNIAYKVYGGLSFYQRKEIKDLIAYLKLTINHYDEEALKRVINYPTRGIGKTSLEKARVIGSEQDLRFWDVLEKINTLVPGGRSNTSISNFILMIKSFATMLETHNAYDLAEHIAKSTGILKDLHQDKSVEGLSRFENIQELLNGIKQFSESHKEDGQSSLGIYMQEIMLLTDQDSEDDSNDNVKLMTIHAAKGLEFKCVYVVGLEENLFPSMMSMSSREDLEEERRLFYVALTRAEKKLFLSFATTRYRFGTLNYCNPSRFLEEIPDMYVDNLALEKQDNVITTKSNDFSPAFSKPFRKANAPAPAHKPSNNFKADDTELLQKGLKVEHQRFGYGQIENIEGAIPNKVAVIEFERVGNKKIMLKYAKLRIVE